MVYIMRKHDVVDLKSILEQVESVIPNQEFEQLDNRI